MNSFSTHTKLDEQNLCRIIKEGDDWPNAKPSPPMGSRGAKENVKKQRKALARGILINTIVGVIIATGGGCIRAGHTGTWSAGISGKEKCKIVLSS